MIHRFLYLVLVFFFSCVHGLAQENKYFGQTELGLTFGRGQEQWDGNHMERLDFTFYTFHGAHLAKNHVLGFSTGYDQYEKISLLPFAVAWRGFLGKENKPQLVGGFDVGGASTLFEKREKNEWSESWYQGGYLISPSAGFKLPSKRGKSSLSITFAYKRQGVTQFLGTLDQSLTTRIQNSPLPPGFNSINETEYLFHSFVFRAGLIF